MGRQGVQAVTVLLLHLLGSVCWMDSSMTPDSGVKVTGQRRVGVCGAAGLQMLCVPPWPAWWGQGEIVGIAHARFALG